MDALRMKTPPWDIQGIECAVWVPVLHQLLKFDAKAS